VYLAAITLKAGAPIASLTFTYQVHLLYELKPEPVIPVAEAAYVAVAVSRAL